MSCSICSLFVSSAFLAATSLTISFYRSCTQYWPTLYLKVLINTSLLNTVVNHLLSKRLCFNWHLPSIKFRFFFTFLTFGGVHSWPSSVHYPGCVVARTECRLGHSTCKTWQAGLYLLNSKGFLQNLQYFEPSGLKTCSHLAKMFPELQFGILALESLSNLKQTNK